MTGRLTPRRPPRAVTLAVAGTLAAGLTATLMIAPQAVAVPAPGPSVTRAAARTAAVPARAVRVDTTSAVERRRVGAVPTPKLRWRACQDGTQCATVRLPVDYDAPKGPTTQLAIVRRTARDAKRRIGSLFVNPGGPGVSATELVVAAPQFLSDDVLDRFDVVGIDPRGVGASDPVRCFRTAAERDRRLAVLDAVEFPYGAAQEKAYVAAAKVLAKACSTTGRPLTGVMSTSQVARDMDVVRRALGDSKLTYLGFSYGTALGQYYANMFPDRVRALVVDGVVNPATWVGTVKTRETVQDDRLRSADGAYKALREVLRRCASVGQSRCSFAGGDPLAKFDLVARRLRTAPVQVPGEFGTPITVTYADFVAYVLGSLYDENGYRAVVDMAQQLLVATEPAPAAAAGTRAAAGREVAALLARARQGRDTEYDNTDEAYSGVACTDGLHPADAGLWPAKLAASDRRAPYFGRAWGYSTIACGRSTWTIRDEDAYTGPWTKRTSGPVLVVGNYWDPATNYAEAVAVARQLPNSRLLASDSWGHTAYGRSACVTRAVDRVLLTRALPALRTVCKGDVQPFGATAAAARTRTAGPVKTEPPLPNPWLSGR